MSLTSVDTFNAQRAQEAVRIIVQKIERSRNRESMMPVETVRVAYEPRLIRRSSTGKCPLR
jgi:DNA-binding LacI/PurR family transcriptional regulator